GGARSGGALPVDQLGAARGRSSGFQPSGEERERSARSPRVTHPILIVLAVVGSLHLFFLLAVELDRNLVHRREVVRLSGEVTAMAAELGKLEAVAGHGDDLA